MSEGAPRVLFVVDGSPSTGLGHITRTSALAAALGRLGVRSTFLIGDQPAVVDKVRRAGADYLADHRGGEGPLDPDQILQLAKESGCIAIVVDSYSASTVTYADLKQAPMTVIAIDDLGEEKFACDVVVNGGAHAEGLPYRRSSATRFLLGPAYAMLREDFWDPAPRVCRRDVADVLVTMGGGKSRSLTERVVESIDVIQADFSVSILRSALSGGGPEFERSCVHRTRTLIDPPDVAACLAAADVAISAGGQTLYELAAVGTPTIAVEVAGNQHDSLNALSEQGCVLGAGRLDDAELGNRLQQTVQRLCDRFETRTAMARSGQRLVDGRGAMRVAQAIKGVLGRPAPTSSSTATGAR